MELDITKQYLRQKESQRKQNLFSYKKKEIKYYDCGKIEYIKQNY